MAKLLTRSGRRLCVLESLIIEHPVRRSGARFQALLPAFALQGLDPARLRFFVVQDDDGNRYAAMIDQISSADGELLEIRGAVVAGS